MSAGHIEMGLTVSAQPRPCPLCAGNAHDVVGTHDRNGEPLRTVMCSTCGHVFTNPAPTAEELSAYYGTKYRAEYKGVLTPKRKHILRAGYRALERLERLAPFAAPPSVVLDIGAGGGEFAYLLASRGYNVSGIEPNAGYAGYARDTYGLDIQATTLEQARVEPGAFDVITLHHVFEHLLDVRAGLSLFHGWLKPGGVLVIEVPNVMSWFHAPRRRFHAAHLHSFNAHGLEDVLMAEGFSIESTLITPGPMHVNIVARKQNAAAPSAFRNAAPEVMAHFKRHTALTHFISGMALSRLWGNALRPWREARALARLGEPQTGREILDRLYQPQPAA
ncbi:MAG: class I SAM-dependent methyltransferase [Rhodospirillaceae bacterium]|nr:class I SAM-dependent methyltransferase [Rhodospirillaceae bacterium]